MRQGWPANDVHGACEHGYSCAGVDERYLADLMTGRVTEGTTPRGILPEEWAYYGTPAHPHHQDPGLFVRVRTNNAGWNHGVPPVVLTYADARTGRRAYRRVVTHGGWTLTPPMRPGLYRVCLTSAAATGTSPDGSATRTRAAVERAGAGVASAVKRRR